MKKVISLWRDYLNVEASKSSRTVDAYVADVRDFALFLEDKKNVILPKDITSQHLIDYLGKLQSVGAKPSTLSRRCSSISMFLTYLHRESFIPENPIEEVPSPREGTKLPSVLSPSQVRELLEAPDPTERLGLRNRALMEVLYATGCRVSEIAGLRHSMVNLNERTIRVLGKGKRERQIPISERARDWIQRYLDEVRPELTGNEQEPHLFLSQKGGALRRESIWRIVKSCARRTSVPEDSVHPHVLRHSFATHMLQNGSNLREVQTLLGHANITTTEIYTHLDVQELKRRHDQHHPREQMDV
jgi:integrase/recombinase XerD